MGCALEKEVRRLWRKGGEGLIVLKHDMYVCRLYFIKIISSNSLTAVCQDFTAGTCTVCSLKEHLVPLVLTVQVKEAN